MIFAFFNIVHPSLEFKEITRTDDLNYALFENQDNYLLRQRVCEFLIKS